MQCKSIGLRKIAGKGSALYGDLLLVVVLEEIRILKETTAME
jgi:hypothetical protein